MKPDPPDRPPLRLLQAIQYAARSHASQKRKDRVTPYISHPVRVMSILALGAGVTDADTLIAAVLHDTMEDTNADYDEIDGKFGRAVARHVAALSKDKRLPEARREREFLRTLAASPDPVRLCKLADTLDNLLDAETLDAEAQSKKADKAQRLLKAFRGKIPKGGERMAGWIAEAAARLRHPSEDR